MQHCNPSSENVVSAIEAARATGVTVKAVKDLATYGVVEAVGVPGGPLMVTTASVERLPGFRPWNPKRLPVICRDADRCPNCGEGRFIRTNVTVRRNGYTRRVLTCQACHHRFALVTWDRPKNLLHAAAQVRGESKNTQEEKSTHGR